MPRIVQSMTIVLSVILFPGAAGFTQDLQKLTQDYTAAKPKVRAGNPSERLEKAKNTLRPILMRIAKLDSAEALGFLRSELEKESPEVAAVTVEAILATSSDKAPEILLGGFAKRGRPVKQEIVVHLAKTKRDISGLEKVLIGIYQSEGQSEVHREFPALLARFHSVAAVKALLSGVGETKGGKGKADDAAEFDRRVVAALNEEKDEAVRGYLSGEAFQGAPPARLVVLSRLAGELKLDAAREQLAKLLDHADEQVAGSALTALVTVGAGRSADEIGESLREGKRSASFRILALDAMAASGGEASLKAVLEAARGSDPETRCIALGSLARVPGSNPAAYDGIVAGLKDSEVLVRGAALRSLQRIRHKGMIPALIDMVAGEKEDRLKIDSLQLLVNITGKNMGLEADDWRKWWEISEPKFEFPKEAGKEKGKTATRSFDLKYFGVEISSKRLAFLVDYSTSMNETVDVFVRDEKAEKAAEEKREPKTEASGGEEPKEKKEERKGPKTKARKIDVLKKELARVVTGLPNDTQINVITFSAAFKAWQETLQPLAGGGREKAISFIRETNTSAGTNVFDTLEFALKDKRVDTVFLLTDGNPSRGRLTDPAGIVREIKALNRIRGVVINCVAFGAESPLLKELAKENGGVYRFVDSY